MVTARTSILELGISQFMTKIGYGVELLINFDEMLYNVCTSLQLTGKINIKLLLLNIKITLCNSQLLFLVVVIVTC